jgi:hypothetical protein
LLLACESRLPMLLTLGLGSLFKPCIHKTFLFENRLKSGAF